MSNIKATANELKALKLILESEFHDGNDPIGNWVWTDCVSGDFGGTKSFSGTASQLQQKGWAKFDGKGREAVCCITQLGFEVLQASQC